MIYTSRYSNPELKSGKYTAVRISVGSPRWKLGYDISGAISELMPKGIFGKYEHWQSKFISNLCCKAMYDLPLRIRQDCMFDYLYVDDLVPIVIWFLEHEPRFHDYNVCTGRPVSLREIADVVLEISGKALPVEVAKEGWNLAYTASCGRLEAEMGPLELHSFKDAVAELYAYYQAHAANIPYCELKKTR